MTSGPADPAARAAVLDTLAAHTDHLTRLDTREAAHHTRTTTQLAGITGLITGITRTLGDHQAALTRLQDPDRQVTGTARPGQDAQPPGYQPGPPPAWYQLTGPGRRDAIQPLWNWVEQVYRPGYGHLAATLGPCWPAHDLCLYGIDIAATLWSVLYLGPGRTPALVSAQAEYQARILPALAAQLMTETTRCNHPQPSHPRSTP